MAFRLPFRSLASKIQAAARENSPSLWHTIGSLVDRNFAAIEQWTQSPESFPNKRVFKVRPTADRSSSSGPWVDWPVGEVLSGTFTKRLDSTRLVVTLLASGFVTGVGSDIDYAVRLDGAGTDYLVSDNYYNTLSEHQSDLGASEIEDIAAGEHTITLRMSSGGATLHADPHDTVVLIVEEVA